MTLDAYRLRLRFVRSETEGPLFDAMALRIEAIASHTGMAGVFRLRSADVCEVLSAVKVDRFLDDRPPAKSCDEPCVADGPLGELRALSLVSARLNRATFLEGLLSGALDALDELFRFRHSMVLLLEEKCGTLVAIASHGYGESGVGAEVPVGAGLVGTVAEQRAPVRLSGVEALLRYGRAVRDRVEKDGGRVRPEIPLPGLPHAEAQLALPLLVGDRLLGVLAVESRDPLAFAEWDEAFLAVIGNQIAIGIDRLPRPPTTRTRRCPRRPLRPGAPPGGCSSTTGTTTASSWTASTWSATSPERSSGSSSASTGKETRVLEP